jgi:hypothetical protein
MIAINRKRYGGALHLCIDVPSRSRDIADSQVMVSGRSGHATKQDAHRAVRSGRCCGLSYVGDVESEKRREGQRARARSKLRPALVSAVHLRETEPCGIRVGLESSRA